jgi:hypothetical protein
VGRAHAVVTIFSRHRAARVKEPVVEPNPRQEQQAKPVKAAMWAAIDRLA